MRCTIDCMFHQQTVEFANISLPHEGEARRHLKRNVNRINLKFQIIENQCKISGTKLHCYSRSRKEIKNSGGIFFCCCQAMLLLRVSCYGFYHFYRCQKIMKESLETNQSCQNILVWALKYVNLVEKSNWILTGWFLSGYFDVFAINSIDLLKTRHDHNLAKSFFHAVILKYLHVSAVSVCLSENVKTVKKSQ